MIKIDQSYIPNNCIKLFQFEHNFYGRVQPISKFSRQHITIVLGNGEKELVKRNTISVSQIDIAFSAN